MQAADCYQVSHKAPHSLQLVPPTMSRSAAAPLLCAGVTVFAPLKRWLTRPGMRVAVLGVGGLGHLAVQFAVKMASPGK